MALQRGRLPFKSHLKISSVMFFFSFECALWTDSSVTADIHTARFVVNVSIKPHLQEEEEKVCHFKAVALGHVSPIHGLGVLRGTVASA